MTLSSRTPFHALILYDESIPGGLVTAQNALKIAQWIVTSSLTSVRLVLHPHLIPFSMLAQNKSLLFSFLRSCSRSPSFLFLYINGHSKIWRGDEAQKMATFFGSPTLFARDGSTQRISSLMYNHQVLFSPLEIKLLLHSIPSSIKRTLFFIDTCHSLSLVSCLLVPPSDLRIIHSSADDEKTWQHEKEGSLMSSAWVQVLSQLPLSQLKRNPSFSSFALWYCMQQVAQLLQMQLLTSGPGQALFFY